MPRPATNSKILSSLKNVFNVRAWSDWDRTRATTEYLLRSLKRLFIPKRSEVQETFEASIARLGLTEQDIILRQRAFCRLWIIMVLMAGGLVGNALYLLLYKNLRGAILSMIIASVSLALAFRYHFWYFQVKERKLGCTLREWFTLGLLRRRSK